MKNLKAKFRDEGKNKRVYKTSRTSKLKIVNPENDEHIIEPNLQSQYRSDDGIHQSTHFTIVTVLRNRLHQRTHVYHSFNMQRMFAICHVGF
jgi:hypothetical protein